MKKNYAFILFILISSLSFGQVFITELADPSDETTCRYVELYNSGATAVDFDTEGYKVQRYTNGNDTPQVSISLTGSIAAGGFYIIGRSGFNGCYGFDPDLSLDSGLASDSNGDDQILILDGLDNVVDIFGVIEEDGTGTCHDFLDGRAERGASVMMGNSGIWNEANWNITGLSSVAGCTNYTNASVAVTDGTYDPGAWIGAPVTNTVVSFLSASESTTEGIGTFDICVAISNPSATIATTVEVNLNASSTAINGSDFSMLTFPETLTFPAGSSVNQCLTITITDDSDVELLEDIVLDLENASGGSSAALGTGVQFTLSINPNDLDVPNVGGVIVTEIMQNPNAVGDSAGEWFEVHNITAADIDMHGWLLSDHNSASYISNTVGTTIVPAGGYLVFANNGDNLTNGGITVVDYDFSGSGTGLANSLGSIGFSAEGTEIDKVDWTDSGSFPVPDGASMELDIAAYNSEQNDDGNNWGIATSAYGDGDLGTPGAVNDFSLSVDDNEINGFSVYPNPINNNTFVIRFLNSTPKSISIFDILGKNVINKTVNNEEIIDVSNLKSGIYILKVEENGKSITRKLIKK